MWEFPYAEQFEEGVVATMSWMFDGDALGEGLQRYVACRTTLDCNECCYILIERLCCKA